MPGVMVVLKGTMVVKKFIILPGLVLACVFLTGCFGLVVAHHRDKCTTRFCLGSRGELTNGPAASAPLTEANVLALWGPPVTVVTNRESLAIWHYVGDRNWTIVMPAYLIGLPLPFPAGHSHADIYFKDGIAQKAEGSVMVLTGAMIGCVPPLALAWEKEPAPDCGGVVVGSGFVKGDKRVQVNHDVQIGSPEQLSPYGLPCMMNSDQ